MQCDAGIGTNAMFEQLYRMPPKLLVLGAGCSAVTEATAQVSHLWNLVQVRDALSSLSASIYFFCLWPRKAGESAFRTTTPLPHNYHNAMTPPPIRNELLLASVAPRCQPTDSLVKLIGHCLID